MEVPSMLRGESLKRLLQGVVLGVALTVVVGFNWLHYGFGWTLGGTAETMASHRVELRVKRTVMMMPIAHMAIRQRLPTPRELAADGLKCSPGV